jgi:hypothetical protein
LTALGLLGLSPKRSDISLDFAAKASTAVGVDGLLFGRRPAWPERRACGGASIATGAERARRQAEALAVAMGITFCVAQS